MSTFSGNNKTRKRLVRPTKIQVARSQNFVCDGCKGQITSDDVYDIHHKDGDSSNYNITNLKVAHVKCHKVINNKKKKGKK
ncbi:MAG: hypothetical protein D4R90_01670 [Nitrosopumilales archaeon]|nr:MAG: hypothetical protein D4R90_01670 [Nitrosopumilales archaeon]